MTNFRPSWTISDFTVNLVEIDTGEGQLQGMLLDTGSETVVIHIHGMCGNYYHNRFVPSLLKSFLDNGISALFVNTSGHDYIAEAMVGDEPRFIGGSLVCQTEIDRDLVAIESVARHRFSRVYFQGHSYGCDVIARNLAWGRVHADGVILLSPADSQALQEGYSGETLADQRQRLSVVDIVATGGPIEPLVLTEVGIKTGTLAYPIPMTPRAIRSFLGDDRRAFRYRGELPHTAQRMASRTSVPAFVYLGRDDPLLLESHDEAREVIEAMFHPVTFADCDGGDHHFTGLEPDLSAEIAAWVADLDRRASAVPHREGQA